MRAALVALAAASSVACGPEARMARAPVDDGAGKGAAVDFEAVEARVIDALAVADPRLARRFDAHASPEIVHKIETAALLAEDATAAMRGDSLDLFAFKARGAALAEATAALAQARAVALERELIARVVDEERARLAEEEPLGDAAAPLIRATVELWDAGATADAWRATDDVTARHLLQIRDSFAHTAPRTSASDLEPALFELEKLLEPMRFGKSAFALTQLHEALDKDPRTSPLAMAPDRLAALAKVHLGVTVTVGLAAELEVARARVASALDASLEGAPVEAIDATANGARALLFSAEACPPVEGSRVRSAAPPPERAAICHALGLIERASVSDARPAALMALHDEIVVASWTLAAPSPRARLGARSFRVDDDLADTLKQMAAARPLVPLAAGLAAAFVYRKPESAPRVASAWRAFGDAPLDITERELGGGSAP